MKHKDKYTILYVDDEESNLRVFRNTFRREFNVLLANNATEAIEILANTKVDVVITDQRMPEITGLELLKIVNEKYPNIPPNRLMISGYAKPDDIDQAYNAYRLYRFVSKPWKQEELYHIILSAIRKTYE